MRFVKKFGRSLSAAFIVAALMAQPFVVAAERSELNSSQFGLQTIRTDTAGSQKVFVEPPLAVQTQRVSGPNSLVREETADLSEVFTLHSDPDSENIIYLDFDGITWQSGNWWLGAFNNAVTEGGFSPGYTVDNDPSTFNNIERQNIFEIWQAISEDFAVFDVDVTTEKPTGERDAQFQQKGAVALFLSDALVQQGCGCGGIAHVDVFGQSNPYLRPSLNFTYFGGPAQVYDIAEIGSHEIGHNLGLLHDGTSEVEYYGGHAMWAPIMGFGRGAGMVTWSDGGYPDAQTRGFQNSIDDFATISRHLPIRVDDVGNDFEGARAITVDGIATFDGLIETRTDVDMFKVEVSDSDSGSLNIYAKPWGVGPNLDIELKLFDENGDLVATSNPLVATNFQYNFLSIGLDAVIDVSVDPGTYYIQVDGVGQGSLAAATGYSDYASVGRFQLYIQSTETRITSVSATAAGPGTAVRLSGIGFPVAAELFLGATKISSVARISESEIVFGVPNISYFGPIQIKAAGKLIATSTSNIDTRRAAVSPGFTQSNKTTYALGEKILLTGQNIGAATAVRIAGESVDFTVTGADSIQVNVVATMTSGEVEITTAGGTVTSQGWLTLQLPPTIIGMNVVRAKPLEVVTITGKNLSWITNVQVSGVSALVRSTSNTQLTFEVPFAKSGVVVLQNQYGSAQSTQALEVYGTFPRIGSFSPASVKVGSKVTVNGQNFVKGTKVFVGKVAATRVKIVAMNKLTFVVPAKAKSGLLKVTTFIGSNVSAKRLVIK